MFPLPIERDAAPPELRPFSLYVVYKRDAPLALNLRHASLHSALGALGAQAPRPDAKSDTFCARQRSTLTRFAWRRRFSPDGIDRVSHDVSMVGRIK